MRKEILFFSVFFNLAVLFYYKYANFIVSEFNALFKTNISLAEGVLLPIGISYFIFQGMSYVIDMYHRIKLGRDVENSFIKMSGYVSMFPQLVAGPIVRYEDIEEDFNVFHYNFENIQEGFSRFIIGLGKKVLIANQVSSFVDEAFLDLSIIEGSFLSTWILMLSYTMQIYFDFSGYSDMAIGLGRMIGFQFNENFLSPYRSSSIQDFWRRWHISLSTWFRDYLYIPLGGNQKGQGRSFLNLWIVFFLCGLWHGASWNFVLWGGYHGSFLVLEKLFLHKYLKKISSFSNLYSFVVVLLGWVLFRSENLKEAMIVYRNLFDLRGFDFVAEIGNSHLFFLAIALCLSLFVSMRIQVFFQKSPVFLFFVFVLSMIFLSTNSYNPFIYFRF